MRLVQREIKGIFFYHRNLVLGERSGKEIAGLKQQLSAFKELELENIRLRELLALKREVSYKVVAARVIARSPDNWSSVIIIDKGRHSGIRQGNAVISHQGLVGRVIETTITTSKVILINDPAFSVSSIIQRSRQEGLICGTLGSTLMMKYLPIDADVKISDKVITSGFTETYPKGIVIGTVTEAGQEFSGLAMYAVVKPAINPADIEEVLVIER